jgi:hypothetical protein
MTIAAVLMRSDPGAELAQLAFYAVIAAVITVVLNSYLSTLREQAHARNHVVETGRDVLIPDHCVQCGRPHARETLRITPKFLGVGPLRQVSDPTIHRDYPFRFCGDCARPIRRHRLSGQLLMALGALFLLHIGVVFLLMLTPFWEVIRNLPDDSPLLPLFGITAWMVDIIAATVFGLWGLFTYRYSPAVKIVDGGAGTIFFRFSNQVFRNHFAELNGVE